MGQTSYAHDIDEYAPVTSAVEAFERRVDACCKLDVIRSVDRAGADVSFGELDAWANAIASELIYRRGSKPEPVPLMVCSPKLMLAAALGVLKAGKFYVAVNPMHPVAHIRRVLNELEAPLVLSDHRADTARPGSFVATSVEEIIETRRQEGRPALLFGESRLAYVLYTSGSTGIPHGVAQSHRDMLHNVARHRPLAIGEGDCVTLISTDGFVASVSNPYIALLGGATLAPYSFKDDGVEGIMNWLEAIGVTVLYGFPSFLRQLAAAEPTRTYAGLRLAYLGGETVLPADLEAARRLFPAATLSVGLNSSETGLTCLHIVAPGAPIPNPVPAGRPVLDIEVAIVDDDAALLAPGESGEIEIHSEFVRPRYWRRGGVQHDNTRAGGFRTGDRGHVDADGVVYHLGRVDQMLKIRGFRVETSEVEAAISALPGVSEVAVFGLGEAPHTELAACVVSRSTNIDPVAIRGAVAHELPPALIPTRVAIVDALPRTANGKLDRQGLERFANSQDRAVTYAGGAPVELQAGPRPQEAAQGAVERRIAEIWRSLLATDRVAPDEDFFALGGTSLSAVSVISLVRSEFGVLVPLAALFRNPTVGALASAVIELQDKHEASGGRTSANTVVRPVEEHDLANICALVNYYIKHTSFNFRTEPQRPAEWLEDWSDTQSRYPWFTASRAGNLVGVAYAGPWKGRAAYDWCAEVTVYVAYKATRTGIGRALYEQLLGTLDSRGYRTQVAVIALPNPASIALHEACDFHHAGTLAGVGYKDGAWLDVGFWHRGERQPGPAPAPIAPVLAE
jgi:acyl-coenzyme A synthetase/AMP-(fatty) acid ligase/L-amino acid N-acyltransferase YncA/acyl carrier protein